MDYFVKEVAGFNTVTHFQHRGDGVPGQMRIVNEEGKEWSYPYPEYAKLSPIQKTTVAFIVLMQLASWQIFVW